MKHSTYRIPVFLLFFSLQAFVLQAQWTEVPVPIGLYPVNGDLAIRNKVVYGTLFGDNEFKFIKTSDYHNWSLVRSFQVPNLYTSAITIPDGDRLYVFLWNAFSAFSVVYHTDDGGQNWSQDSLPPQYPISYFQPMGNIQLAANDSLVFKRENSGNWQSTLQAPESIRDMRQIDSQTVLITTKHWLYRSGDRGVTWAQLPAPYNAVNVNYYSHRIYPTRQGTFINYYNDTIVSVYRSDDLGLTWKAFATPTTQYGYSFLSDLQSKGGQLLGTFNAGLSSSLDSGATWQPVFAPNYIDRIGIIGDTLFTVGGNGYFKSLDAGHTWLSSNSSLKALVPVKGANSDFSLMDVHKDRLFVCDNYQTFSTRTDGDEWQLVYNNGWFNQKFSLGDTILFLGADGVLRSPDDGNHWEFIPGSGDGYGPLTGYSQYAHTGKYIFSYSWSSDTLFRSGDLGTTWEVLLPNFSFGTYLAGTPNRLILAESDYLHVSDNFGQSFYVINAGLGNNPNLNGVWSSGNDFYTISESQLYRLKNNVWKPASIGLFDDMGNVPIGLQIIGSTDFKILSGSGELSPYLPYIYSSNDGGTSWEGNLADSLPIKNWLVALKGHTLYVNGETPDYYSQIWKRGVTVATNEPGVGTVGCRVYPNPAGSEAWLEVGAGVGQTFRATMFDLTGRVVWESGLVTGQGCRLPVGELAKGVYSVMVMEGYGKVGRVKVVVDGSGR